MFRNQNVLGQRSHFCSEAQSVARGGITHAFQERCLGFMFTTARWDHRSSG